MLTIIIGGKAQGKLAYVLNRTGYRIEKVCDGGQMIPGSEIVHPIINHFHLYIRRALQQGYSLEKILEQIQNCKGDLHLICDEVGSGVVPMDAFERNYREQVGRMMCKLVKDADQVIRIQCGIGQILKDKTI